MAEGAKKVDSLYLPKYATIKKEIKEGVEDEEVLEYKED
jgi:hypothetical protein